jgi:tetratricopeptide (TPR) repeat protein/tRNA A-37 threonylcarbamoyl transferase component Bud32
MLSVPHASTPTEAIVMLLANVLAELIQKIKGNPALGAEEICRPYVDHPEYAALLAALERAMRGEPSANVTAETAAARRSHSPVAELPARVGRYHIEQEIARGGMGRIVRVRDEDFDRPLAMKLLLGHGGELEERFLREARMTGQLQHPGIPPVHERGRLADGRPYFVMKLIQGRSLQELLRERTAPTAELPRWVGIFAQICQTVGYAHARSVLHRDLKPANVMVGAFGEVQVMDWGLAKFIGAADESEPDAEQGTVFGLKRTVALAEATSADSVLGTPAYMAPEQARGEYSKMDARADVFSLGAILCEILTGAPAFRGRDALLRASLGELTEALERLAGCGADAELVELARRCLAPSPDDRPADGAAVAASVANYQAELERRLRQAEMDRAAAAARAEEQSRRREAEEARANAERNRRRMTMALAAALLLLAVIGGVGAVLVNEARREADARAEAESNAKQSAQVAQEAALRAEGQAMNNLREAQKQQKEAELERERAEVNFRKARAAVDEYLTRVSEHRLLKVPGMQPLRRDLLQSALSFYKDFLKEHANQPELQTELAAVQLRLGRIDFDLGLRTEARAALDAAIAAYEAALARDPKNADVRAGLADALYVRAVENTPVAAWTFVDKVPAESLDRLQRAAQLREQLRRDHPTVLRYQHDLTESHVVLSAFHGKRRPDEALALLRQAIDELSELARAEPDNPDNLYALSVSFSNLGSLLSLRGRYLEGTPMFERAIEFGKAAYAMNPQALDYGGHLTNMYLFQGAFHLGVGKQETAWAMLDQGVETGRRLAADNPHVPYSHAAYAISLAVRGKLQEFGGRKEEAAKSRALAFEAFEHFPRRTAHDYYLEGTARALYATITDSIGATLGLTDADRKAQHRQADLAMQALERAVDLGFKEIDRLQTDEDLHFLRGRADFQALVAKVDAAVKAEATHGSTPLSAEEKSKAQEAALALRLKLAADDPRNRPVQVDLAAGLLSIGLTQVDLGQYDEARKSIGTALTMREQLVKAAPQNRSYRADLATTHVAMGRALRMTGRLADCVQSWQKGLDMFAALVKEEPGNPTWARQQADADFAVGKAYAELGIHDRAAAHFGRAVDWFAPEDNTDAVTKDVRILTSYLVLAGDEEAYRKACAKLLQKYRDTKNVNRAAQTALSCATAPRAVDDLKAVLRLADEAVAADPKRPFFLHTLAAAYYRLDRFDDALRALDLADQVEPQWPFRVCNDLLRAMCEHRLKRADAARQALAKASQWFDVEVKRKPPSPFGPWATPYWWNYPYFETLRHEAWTLIDGAPCADELVERLERARRYHELGETKRAAAEFQAVVALRPQEPAVWLARSRVFAEMQRDAEADADQARAAALASTDAGPWLAQAQFFAWRGQWSRARTCYDRSGASVEHDKGSVGFEQACIFLLTDDEPAYRRVCSQLLASGGKAQVRSFFVTRTCTLKPGAADDLARAEQIAAAELTKFPTRPWAIAAAAAQQCRAGHYKEAADKLRQCLRDNAADNDVVRWLWLALALDGAGQLDEARTWFDKAGRWLDQHAAAHPSGLHLHDWLEAQVLRREAITRLAADKR